MSYENILYETDGRLAFITLNRPEKLNALSNELRGELFHALKEAEADRAIGVIVLRANGRAFSAGYDLAPARSAEPSSYVHPRSGMPDTGTTHPAHYDWSRHVLLANWTIWELSKPVVAQVHGYCLAGGSELATCCDLVYMADDAQMGYPAVRFGVPDNHFHPWFLGMRKAMEMMLTGDSISGVEAARRGWANESYPADQLEAKVLEVAQRIVGVPADLVQLNKRVVHRQMEIMGLHTGIRVGSELCALGTHQKSMHEFLARIRKQGLTGALQERDAPFADYRTKKGDD